MDSLSAHSSSSRTAPEVASPLFRLDGVASGLSDELLAAALHHISSPVVITSAKLSPPGPEIVYVNPAFTKVTGYSFEEVRGETPRILQGEKTDPLLLDVLKESLREHRHFKGETVNYRKDGSAYVIEWEINPIRDEEGGVRFWIAVQRDVTERHHLEREVLNVSSDEQKRIAEDLHDNIGQMMSGLVMEMKALGRSIAASPDSGLTRFLRQDFDDLTQHMKDALDRLRRHVRELYPVSLAEEGLVPGLRELAANAEVLYGVGCSVYADDGVDITSKDLITQLYRITQEAISTSVKHGGATAIEIRLSVDGDHLLLTIENNGTHIDPETVVEADGIGFRIMRQRARAVRAVLNIRPTDRGAEVVVSVKGPDLVQ